MKLEVLLINQEEKMIDLSENESNGNKIWTGTVDGYEEPSYKISIFIDNNNTISVKKGSNIASSDNDIKEDFRSNLLEIKERSLENELSGLESTGDTSEIIEKLQPYDPELIRVETKNMNISYVYEMMVSDHGDLDLSPNFQRNFVWTDITSKSRLIESILLRIPLPVFYLSQDNSGRLQVVDGVQRLSVIKAFLSNEFKLKNLEYLEDCEGCYFEKGSKTLDSKYVRRIKQTQLTINIIDPQTPHEVKFDIFKRINTGGKPLNYQEIRNCFANNEIRLLLNELSTSEEFVNAIGSSVSSIRMADQELIMRFIGFYYVNVLKTENNFLKYRGNMNQFLNDTLEVLNNENIQNINRIKQAFLNSMNIASYLFGEYAFRKCTTKHLNKGAKKQLINRSLFTSLSVLLTEYNYNRIEDFIEKNGLVRPLALEIEQNEVFFVAITYGTSDKKRIDQTFNTIQEILDINLKG